MPFHSLIVGAVLFLAAAPATPFQNDDRTAPEPPATLTLADWSKLTQIERQVTIMAAIEGLVIASTDSTAAASPFDAACLVDHSPAALEQTLLPLAAHYPDQSVIDVYLAITKCHASMKDEH